MLATALNRLDSYLVADGSHADYSDSTTRVVDSRGFNGGRRDSAHAILAEHDVSGESGIEAAKDCDWGGGFGPDLFEAQLLAIKPPCWPGRVGGIPATSSR